MKNKDKGSPNQHVNITDIRPALEGVYVSIICWKCSEALEHFLATVAGLGFGRLECPGCRSVQEIFPEDFLAALEHFLPTKSKEEMGHLIQEADRIAENWYRNKALAELFSYRGVNLGEPTERALFAYISLGLYLDAANRQK